jgi:hypothetical protein
LPRRKTRTRHPELVAALAAALWLAGCGGDEERQAAPPPRLPGPIASQLAERSDAVAAALDGGDSCRARDEALHLQQETIAAIKARRVPAPFQEPLAGSVNDLVSRIVCSPPPGGEEEEDDEGEGGRGRGKGKGKDKKERD